MKHPQRKIQSNRSLFLFSENTKTEVRQDNKKDLDVEEGDIINFLSLKFISFCNSRIY